MTVKFRVQRLNSVGFNGFYGKYYVVHFSVGDNFDRDILNV